MKKYKVMLQPDAETDIKSSYEWGCRVWGEKRAKAWVRELRHTLKARLTSMPLGCALAPESEELDVPVRHLMLPAIGFSLPLTNTGSRFFTLDAHMSISFSRAERLTNSTLSAS